MHIWVWWVTDDGKLGSDIRQTIQANERTGLAISIISCWEVAKLHEKKRIIFSVPLKDWIEKAIAYPGFDVLDLNIDIILKSTSLKNFHDDPADQFIAATSIVYDIPLISMDEKIISYPYLKKIQT